MSAKFKIGYSKVRFLESSSNHHFKKENKDKNLDSTPNPGLRQASVGTAWHFGGIGSHYRDDSFALNSRDATLADYRRGARGRTSEIVKSGTIL